jgi:ankyrin repeat protein
MESMEAKPKRSAWRIAIVALVLAVILVPLFLVHEEPGKALRRAAFKGDVQTVKKILRDHPEVINSYHTEDRTFHHPWYFNARDSLRSFGSPQFDELEDHELSALEFAVFKYHPKVVSILLDNNAETINHNMCSVAFDDAIQSGDVELVKVFLNHKVDVNLRGCSGYTPLARALMLKRQGIVEPLIAQGANLNEGLEPPLHYAVKTTNRAFVELLVNKGANVNLQDAWYRTPLDIATNHVDATIELFLRKHGAK